MAKSRPMSEADMDNLTAEVRAMIREHPEVIARKIGEYVNLIVQGCRLHDAYMVDVGHVSLQAIGQELALVIGK